MRKHKPTKWIRTTIAEPFPVFYSHVSQKARRCGEAEGPFYAAGAEFFHLHDEQNLAWRQGAATNLRADGYTVSVDVVTR
jgi:hypothetical protein